MQQLPIDFAAGRERGRVGMRRSAERADRDCSGWVHSALDALKTWVAGQDGVFTIEQVRAGIEGTIPAPKELRAWGQVTQMARRRGLIAPCGVRPAASSNGSLKPAYRRGGGEL